MFANCEVFWHLHEGNSTGHAQDTYRQVSNIGRGLIGNQIVDHSDVVGASPNYIFILHLTLGFNILRKDNCKPRRETFKFWDLVRLILEILRYPLYDFENV